MNGNAKRRFARAGLRLMVVWVAFAFSALAEDALKKVSHSEALAAAVAKAAPEYPSIARQLKIQGVVELEALVTENGAVEKVNIVSGNPTLTKPAAEALKKWKFNPFMAEGQAVKATAQVSMTFKL
jgi:protein TonB